jgi:hypothetical protein
MRAFISVCAAVYPSLIPLYVTGSDLASAHNSFTSTNLEAVMLAAAAQYGVTATGIDGLTAALEAAGKKMFVILDECE